jgi:hypothetical protein
MPRLLHQPHLQLIQTLPTIFTEVLFLRAALTKQRRMTMLNLRADFLANQESADFRLLISAADGDNHLATITSISIDDPDLQGRLRDIAQAYRMGARYGKET